MCYVKVLTLVTILGLFSLSGALRLPTSSVDHGPCRSARRSFLSRYLKGCETAEDDSNQATYARRESNGPPYSTTSSSEVVGLAASSSMASSMASSSSSSSATAASQAPDHDSTKKRNFGVTPQVGYTVRLKEGEGHHLPEGISKDQAEAVVVRNPTHKGIVAVRLLSNSTATTSVVDTSSGPQPSTDQTHKSHLIGMSDSTETETSLKRESSASLSSDGGDQDLSKAATHALDSHLVGSATHEVGSSFDTTPSQSGNVSSSGEDEGAILLWPRKLMKVITTRVPAVVSVKSAGSVTVWLAGKTVKKDWERSPNPMLFSDSDLHLVESQFSGDGIDTMKRMVLALHVGQENSGSSDSSHIDNDQRNQIDLNFAPVGQLEELPGVGQKLATDVVESRTLIPFCDPADIQRINGIGEEKFKVWNQDSLICAKCIDDMPSRCSSRSRRDDALEASQSVSFFRVDPSTDQSKPLKGSAKPDFHQSEAQTTTSETEYATSHSQAGASSSSEPQPSMSIGAASHIPSPIGGDIHALLLSANIGRSHLVSGGDWKCQVGSKSGTGWHRNDFDDSTWSSARLVLKVETQTHQPMEKSTRADSEILSFFDVANPHIQSPLSRGHVLVVDISPPTTESESATPSTSTPSAVIQGGFAGEAITPNTPHAETEEHLGPVTQSHPLLEASSLRKREMSPVVSPVSDLTAGTEGSGANTEHPRSEGSESTATSPVSSSVDVNPRLPSSNGNTFEESLKAFSMVYDQAQWIDATERHGSGGIVCRKTIEAGDISLPEPKFEEDSREPESQAEKNEFTESNETVDIVRHGSLPLLDAMENVCSGPCFKISECDVPSLRRESSGNSLTSERQSSGNVMPDQKSAGISLSTEHNSSAGDDQELSLEAELGNSRSQDTAQDQCVRIFPSDASSAASSNTSRSESWFVPRSLVAHITKWHSMISGQKKPLSTFHLDHHWEGHWDTNCWESLNLALQWTSSSTAELGPKSTSSSQLKREVSHKSGDTESSGSSEALTNHHPESSHSSHVSLANQSRPDYNSQENPTEPSESILSPDQPSRIQATCAVSFGDCLLRKGTSLVTLKAANYLGLPKLMSTAARSLYLTFEQLHSIHMDETVDAIKAELTADELKVLAEVSKSSLDDALPSSLELSEIGRAVSPSDINIARLVPNQSQQNHSVDKKSSTSSET